MTLKPPTRTLPKLVMKEWPVLVGGEPFTGRVEVTSVATGEGRSYTVENGKILSGFTQVVEQTGILKQPSAFDVAMDETRKSDAEAWAKLEQDLKREA